jgi:hypothetical protein
MRELHPAATNPGMLELGDTDLVIGRDVCSGLVDELAVHQNASRHDQRLRLRARVNETALDQDDVEALLFHGMSESTVKPSWRK